MLPIPKKASWGKIEWMFFDFSWFLCENTHFPRGSAIRGKKCIHQGLLIDSHDRAYNCTTTGKTSAEMISGSVLWFWCKRFYSSGLWNVKLPTYVRRSCWFLACYPERSFHVEYNRDLVTSQICLVWFTVSSTNSAVYSKRQKLEDMFTTSKFRIYWRWLSV